MVALAECVHDATNCEAISEWAEVGKTLGASSQVIALPQGGGALHGIGEKFSPDLFTGTGSFTLPLALPPGRNGFQPQLSLGYSTGNGNGPFGLGWNLSVPGVSRKTSKGLPLYDDSTDTFILSGAEDLVPVEESGAVTRYRPRTEGLFAQISHRHDLTLQDDYWEVQTKDGLVSLYGTPGTAGNDPAVVADPMNRGHVFAWRLTLTTDPFGNRIEYLYQRDAIPTEETHHWDQLYLSEIHYVDDGDAAHPQFLVKVALSYAHRPDLFSDYRAGFEIRTVQRCTAIDISTNAGAPTPTRTYHLAYLDQQPSPPPTPLPLNLVSHLFQVQVEGHDGANSERLPPLEFGYSGFKAEQRQFSPITGPDMPPASLAHPDYELVDLFGCGLLDILEMNGTVRYWRNLGAGRYDWPRDMRDAPAGLGLADPGVQMADANGDGSLDLLVTTDKLAGYYPLRFGGLWDRRSFQRYRMAPSFDLKDPEVHLVDLNGDGVTDAIRSGTRLECFFNDPAEGWNETRAVERQALEVFPNVNFSDPRVKWADMTGDGLQDIVLVYDGSVEYWPSLGRGNWAKRVTMRDSPRFPYGYDPKRILLGDVDGDGVADLVYVDDKQVTLWINQGGNGWSAAITIQGTPPVSDMDAVRLADILGNGISGVLWSTDAVASSRRSMFFLDFTGGIKPYLLDQMDNHMGSITRVGYAPSSRFFLEDEKRPESRWKTPLPFPVQVVAQVEAIDAISGGKLSTEYSYHHGYWDGAEREFRGFGRVDQRDTETFDAYHATGLHAQRPFQPVAATMFSSPTETRTWFHQGPIGDEFGDWIETAFGNEFWPGDPQLLTRPQSVADLLNSLPRRAKRDALRSLRGHVLRSELYALDGTAQQDLPYTVTEQVSGVREEMPPGLAAAGQEPEHIFFPYAIAQRTTQWERGDDPLTSFAFTEDYDAYGQPQLQTQIACPRGWRSPDDIPGQSYLARRSRTVYALPASPQVFLVDRVAKASTYEIVNDGSQRLFDVKALPDGSPIGQTLNFYDGDIEQTDHLAFVGLPNGQLGDYGALVRTESLVLTESILQDAYKSGSVILTPPEEPPYLSPSGAPVWSAEYPPEFRNLLLPLAGYTYQPGGAGSAYATGYFAATERRRYDFHDDPNGKGQGLVKATRDALGHDTTVAHDSYNLLPKKVSGPTNLMTEASYDYRVLQPNLITDPNGNRTAYAFSPLGLLASTAVMGKVNETVGDTPTVPGTQLVYDFSAYENRAQPISVQTIRRVHHVNETDVPEPERSATIETLEYSDGFGRLLQTRTQAEDTLFGDPTFGGEVLPANQADQTDTLMDIVGRQRATNDPPNVAVSGWQVYDNKGRVVEKYEPVFGSGWDYGMPGSAQLGEKVTIYYDPLGRVIRTVNPDGSEQRAIYGVPPDLTDPDIFIPTAWENYTYDVNDNAGRTDPSDSTPYKSHWNTPASAVVDALGRTIQTVARNGSNPASDWFTTHSTYDIRGNVLTVTDALGRAAFQHIYDLGNRPLRVESIDAGIRRTVLDAAGNTVEQRDGKGALRLHAYDALNRPLRLWARDNANESVTWREVLIYGDAADAGLTHDQAAASNLLGKLYEHYDEAGLATLELYDFKGNVLEKTRQVIGDSVILSVFSPPPPNWQVQAYRVDWQPPSGTPLTVYASTLLDATAYRTSSTFDALNRIKTLTYPQGVDGARRTLAPHYNPAGALERVDLDAIPYVQYIAYDAKGQRTLIAYGNGIMTRYAYDPRTFRLVRMRSEHYSKPAALTHHPTGAPLQDLAYEYDLVGNIIALRDRTPGSGIPNTPLGTESLDRIFTYDPIYRLLSATGRECDAPPPPPPWIDQPRCIDLTLRRPYTEQYQYDPAGNMTQLRHGANGGSLTRRLALVPNTNRLLTMTIGPTIYHYTNDSNGNLVRENSSRHFEWDHSDRMRVYRTQTDGAEPSVHAQYLYDAGGQRVKKLVRKQGGQNEVTVYVDGLFEYQRVVQSSTTRENNLIHVMDNQSRIALVRVGTPFPDDTTPAIKYQLGDHLGSSNVVIEDSGVWINREEYTPYGETSFGSFAKKRYRFTGKERDEESSLYYHGARYYAPWLTRWVTCDPIGRRGGPNAYSYARTNPLVLVDPDGRHPLLILAILLLLSFKHDERGGSDVRPIAALTPPGALVAAASYGVEGVQHLSDAYAAHKQMTEMVVNRSPCDEAQLNRLKQVRNDKLWDATANLVVVAAIGMSEGPRSAARAPSPSGGIPKEYSPAAPEGALPFPPKAYTDPPGYVQERAMELWHSLRPEAQGRITVGVHMSEGPYGRQVTVSTSGGFRTEIRPYLQLGESVAMGGKGIDAEQAGLNWASVRGQQSIATGSSRPMCHACADAVTAAGSTPGTTVRNTAKEPLH